MNTQEACRMHQHGTLESYVRLIRVKHWIKNMFVLAPLIFSLKFCVPDSLFRVLIMFFSFSLASSVVYTINDIADRERDRFHPDKKNRPIASGVISVANAAILAVALFSIALAGAWYLSPQAAAVVVAYVALNLLYSYFLKHHPCIDVMGIAIGFLLRVIAGAIAIEVEVSEWMLLTTFFLSLLLGFGKRRKEMLATDGSIRHRVVFQQYSLELLNHLILICAGLTIITYSIYVILSGNMIRLGSHRFVATIPIVVFGVFRYLFLIYHENDGGDPADILLRDRAMQVDILLWGGTVFVLLLIALSQGVSI